MDYTSPEKIPHYKECSDLVESLGMKLVELQIGSQNGLVRITAVVASGDPKKDMGVAECAKAHRALQNRLIELLHKTEDDISMEVCSPGIERNMKDAFEFQIFKGREVRVWDKTVSDWVRGVIDSADETQVTLETEGGEKKSVAYIDIAKAKFIHL